MPNLHDQYERLLEINIEKTGRAIRKHYQAAIHEVTVGISSVRYKNTPFALKDYPALAKKVEQLIKKLHGSTYTLLVNSIAESWDLSNKKNSLLIDKRLAGRRPVKSVRKIIYDPNKRALETFINRKEKGMNLSDRVWNALQPVRSELEQSLGLAIASGKSAASTASDIKKFLNEPDRLYRRVRDENGKLVLSKAAREYSPGRGVYRSSYKNALRLTATENNMAYRTSDFHRWNNLPFVIGIEVRLSDNHPRYDICDHLAGRYPKDFLFRGWHPFCRCNAIPILSTDQDFEAMEDAILAGKPLPSKLSGTINTVPKSFTKWLKENSERVSGWKSIPYWMKDNPKYLHA